MNAPAPIAPTPTSGRPGRAPLPTAVLALACLALGACAGSSQTATSAERQKMSAEGHELFNTPTTRPANTRNDTAPSATPATPDAWSIVLVAYRNNNRRQIAQQDLTRVRQAGLPDAYVDDRGEATVIAYGSYRGPEERKAQSDLDRIRNMVVDGARPFSGAILSPPDAADAGSVPQYDLRNAKKELGNWVIYTLQIGAYGKLDGRATPEEMAQFRQAAEQAVLQLRREGEQAWYYHGPTKSMVLIGAFSAEDFEPNPVPGMPPLYESPALKQAREKFPNNLFNGQGIRDNTAGTLQTSSLVGVPNN